MAEQQGQKDRGQGRGNPPRRDIYLEAFPLGEDGPTSRRVHVQATVLQGKQALEGQEVRLLHNGQDLGTVPLDSNNQAHWNLSVPNQAQRFQAIDEQERTFSLLVTLEADVLPTEQQSSLSGDKRARFVVSASPKSDSETEYELAILAFAEGGTVASKVPVRVRYGDVSDEGLTTDEYGTCIHKISIAGTSVKVSVESPGFESWSTRLFSQKKPATP